jgi:uncharacterized protein YkwD
VAKKVIANNPQKKVASKKPRKQGVFKRPNINLLVGMAVLTLTLGLVLFQVQQRQDPRTRAQLSNCTVTAAQLQTSSQEQALFDQINAYRQQQGRDPLVWEQNLNRAAAWMSKDMITSGNVSHMDSLGRTEEQRFPACGVGNTGNFGEAVISGAAQADEILGGWKIDPPDNAVLLDPSLSEGAVAMEVDATGEAAYWTFTASGPPSFNVTPTSGPPPTNIPIVTEGPQMTTVPSPACLGGVCPTLPGSTTAPTQTVPTTNPGGGGGGGGGGTVAPTQPGGGIVDPSGNPLNPSGNPLNPSGTPGGGGGGGDQGGLIGWFLALLALIIKFFLSLVGR